MGIFKETNTPKSFEELRMLLQERVRSTERNIRIVIGLSIAMVIIFLCYKVSRSGARWFIEFFRDEPLAYPLVFMLTALLVYILALIYLNEKNSKVLTYFNSSSKELLKTTDKDQINPAHEEQLLDRIKSIFERDYTRISEIKHLNRRANVNLATGLFFAVSAFLFLVGFELLTIKSEADFSEVLRNYFFRVTGVILLDIIAFFFLKSYKSTLAQIEYYQSELTRISTNEIAMEAAISTGDKNILFKTVHAIIQSQPSHPHPWAVSNESKLDSETVKKLLELVPKG